MSDRVILRLIDTRDPRPADFPMDRGRAELIVDRLLPHLIHVDFEIIPMTSAALAPPIRGGRALESAAWVGLVAGLLLLASAFCLPGRAVAGPLALYALPPLTPDDLTRWAQAVAAAIGALTAAANGVAILVHRWGKAARKSRKKPPETKP